MAMLFLDPVLIGAVGMVTCSMPNWLSWAECTNSFSFLCAWVNACKRVSDHYYRNNGKEAKEGFKKDGN